MKKVIVVSEKMNYNIHMILRLCEYKVHNNLLVLYRLKQLVLSNTIEQNMSKL